MLNYNNNLSNSTNIIQTSINTSSSPSSSTSSPSSSCTPCLKCNLSQPISPSPWILCALCSSSWHWSCVTINPLDPIHVIEKWFCRNCVQINPNLIPIYKEASRKSARKKLKNTSYDDASIDPESNPDRFINLASGKKNVIDAFNVPKDAPHKPFRKMKACELTMEWLVQDQHAMSEPVVIDDPEGLFQMGMRMPSKDLTIGKIAELVGVDTPVEVIDVASQSELSRWSLGQWADYFEDNKRERVRNVISLEVSETSLGSSIHLPKIVTDMDWVHTIWPAHLRVHASGSYPKVQKYCLMSVARCWTDWHIDFAGSSVFYHILRGAKTFYFIRPTVANLAKYEKWSGSSKLQESTWLGDQVNVVYKVSLTAGQTMMIPTGWIHAVHTPVDSLVFGGNFLHSLNIPTQLRVHQIENSTKVPKKFRFPFFIHILWFVLLHYNQKLELGIERADETNQTTPSHQPLNLDCFSPIPHRILSGLSALSDFLLTQTDPTDSHPALSSKELLNYLEHHLNSDRLSNLRQTVLNFQKLLNRFQDDSASSLSNGSMIKLGSNQELLQFTNSSNPVHVDDNHNCQNVMDKTVGTFRSPLQITIKRKPCVPGVNQTTGKMMVKDSGPENKSPKETTKITIVKAKEGANPQGNNCNHPKSHETKKRRADEKMKRGESKNMKLKQSVRSESKVNVNLNKNKISTLSSVHKLTGGEILSISNPTPTSEIRFEKRKRPRFQDDKHQQKLPKIKSEVNEDDDDGLKGERKRIKDKHGDLYSEKNQLSHQDEKSSVQPSFNNNKDSKEIDLMEQRDQSRNSIKLEEQEIELDLNDYDQNHKLNSDQEIQVVKEEDVEVRTTQAFNSVVRKWLDPVRNKIVYETRTVKTSIEKVYFNH